MASMKSQIKNFLSLIESKPFKILVIIGDGNYKISTRNPQKLQVENNRGTIVYCEGKALIISEYGNHKMMDEERVKDLEGKFKHLID